MLSIVNVVPLGLVIVCPKDDLGPTKIWSKIIKKLKEERVSWDLDKDRNTCKSFIGKY